MRVILVGYGECASALLMGVLESGHQVVGVLRHEYIAYSPTKRILKDFFAPNELLTLINKYKIPQIKAPSVNSKKFFNQALKLQPDIILVGSWSEVLDSKIINMPTLACINCHPSLLPRYRGPNPYIEVIRNGETQTGITFHLMTSGLDQGPILMQKSVPITFSDTGATLRAKCTYEARKMIPELFDGLENGATMPVIQNEKLVTYFPRTCLKDVILDFNKPAIDIYNQIRAFSSWQSCYVEHENNFIKVRSSQVLDIKTNLPPGCVFEKNEHGLVISCANNSAVLLENPRLFGFPWGVFSDFYLAKMIKKGDVLQKF